MRRFSVFLLLLFFLFPLSSVAIELTGAGATFPYPFYSKLFHEYHKRFGVKVNYQAIGSGGGIRQLIEKTVDFGATDAFMTDEELKMAHGEILHIPTCAGAVVLTYNLPGSPKIKLTPELVADIFLGKVKRWSDSKLTSINPGVKLPDIPIVVVHRSDGSGTTYVFSDYLCKVSKEWEEKVGRGKSLNWPVGIGGKGNPGVAGIVQQIPGSIGYVELVYALSNGMPVASIMNSHGRFVEPSVETVALAADVPIPSDARASITNSSNPESYPISSFTWIIVYREQCYADRSRKRAEALAKLLWWIVHDGQKFARPLCYAPLPESAVKVAERIILSMTYQGKPLLKR